MEKEELQILQMVKDGTVTPEQGAELLAALKNPGSGAITSGAGAKPQFLRVKVHVDDASDGDGKHDKVDINCNLPIALADLAVKMAQTAKITKGGESIELGNYLKEVGNVDFAAVLALIKEGASGRLVDINVDGGDGEKVKIEVVVD
jgi:hypothetical protein